MIERIAVILMVLTWAVALSTATVAIYDAWISRQAKPLPRYVAMGHVVMDFRRPDIPAKVATATDEGMARKLAKEMNARADV